MRKFVELNFAYGPDWVQNEIVPTDHIEGMFIESPDGECINIRYRPAGGSAVVEQREKYEDAGTCYERWIQLRKILEVEENKVPPVPMSFKEFCGGD